MPALGRVKQLQARASGHRENLIIQPFYKPVSTFSQRRYGMDEPQLSLFPTSSPWVLEESIDHSEP